LEQIPLRETYGWCRLETFEYVSLKVSSLIFSAFNFDGLVVFLKKKNLSLSALNLVDTNVLLEKWVPKNTSIFYLINPTYVDTYFESLWGMWSKLLDGWLATKHC